MSRGGESFENQTEIDPEEKNLEELVSVVRKFLEIGRVKRLVRTALFLADARSKAEGENKVAEDKIKKAENIIEKSEYNYELNSMSHEMEQRLYGNRVETERRLGLLLNN